MGPGSCQPCYDRPAEAEALGGGGVMQVLGTPRRASGPNRCGCGWVDRALLVGRASGDIS